MRMRFEAHECRRDQDARAPSLYAMKEIAWNLNLDEGGRPVGFTPPAKQEEGESLTREK
jgi:hypothetical protein